MSKPRKSDGAPQDPQALLFVREAEKAMRRAAKVARKAAIIHNTPVYFVKNGRIIAERPKP